MLVVFIQYIDDSFVCIEDVHCIKYYEDKVYISNNEFSRYYKLSFVKLIRAYIEWL